MREYRYEINGKNYRVRIKEIYGEHAVVEVNNQVYQVNIKTATVPQPLTAQVKTAPATAGAPARPAPASPARPGAASPGTVTAPMPGVILRILVDEGDMVNAADTVMVIEAMKMENEIKAAVSGTVKKILVESGDSVNTGDELILIGD